MSPEQRKAVAVAKALFQKLKRRPFGNELRKAGVNIGTNCPFLRLNALLVAADLAVPAPDHLAGFTPTEEKELLRRWEAGEPTKVMAAALGVMPRVLTDEVSVRRLKRVMVRRKKDDPIVLLRRCQEPRCGKLTEGAGPCRHCGAEGLTNAA